MFKDSPVFCSVSSSDQGQLSITLAQDYANRLLQIFNSSTLPVKAPSDKVRERDTSAKSQAEL